MGDEEVCRDKVLKGGREYGQCGGGRFSRARKEADKEQSREGRWRRRERRGERFVDDEREEGQVT